MKKRIFFSLFVASVFASANVSAIEKNADGFYELGTPQDLMDFAALVNSAKANRTLSAILTSDIDLAGVENFTPIGTYSDTNGTTISYRGTFEKLFIFSSFA